MEHSEGSVSGHYNSIRKYPILPNRPDPSALYSDPQVIGETQENRKQQSYRLTRWLCRQPRRAAGAPLTNQRLE